MSGALLALRKAILAHVSADPALASLMGGGVRLHDEPPRAAEPVYAVFGDARVDDWSTDSDRGHEQTLSLVVWAKAGSARTGLLVADRIASLLDGADLALEGHRLVALEVTATEAGRDKETGLARSAVSLRALTEEL